MHRDIKISIQTNVILNVRGYNIYFYLGKHNLQPKQCTKTMIAKDYLIWFWGLFKMQFTSDCEVGYNQNWFCENAALGQNMFVLFLFSIKQFWKEYEWSQKQVPLVFVPLFKLANKKLKKKHLDLHSLQGKKIQYLKSWRSFITKLSHCSSGMHLYNKETSKSPEFQSNNVYEKT